MAVKNQCVATVEVLINLRIDINAQNNVSINYLMILLRNMESVSYIATT